MARGSSIWRFSTILTKLEFFGNYAIGKRFKGYATRVTRHLHLADV